MGRWLSGVGQRRYERSVLRRVSVIRAAQTVGLSLEQIREAFEALPDGRAPTARDCELLSKRWRVLLDRRIGALERLRDRLSGCICCGCLSLMECALLNPGDVARAYGTGAVVLSGEGKEE